MSCSAGVCTPTAKNALLNAGDLEGMLATGGATVTTTGTGFQANDIILAAPVSWSGSTPLTLDAARRLTIEAPVTVSGTGSLALADNGEVAALSFGRRGNVTFANLSSSLSINGTPYLLVNTVSSLAGAIGSNPSGAFAFAKSYDAKADGSYSAAPIATAFTGVFEGLGNTISHLKIKDASDSEVGLFAFVNGGYIHDIGLEKANVSSSTNNVILGVLAGFVTGAQIQGSSYSGAITGSWSSGALDTKKSAHAQVGGLVGSACNSGAGFELDAVIDSHSSVKISGGQSSFVGGLVGYSCGTGLVDKSYATGAVTAGTCSYAGGLIGASTAYVRKSFATGSATTGNDGQCGPPPSVGGLVGYNFGVGSSPGTITNSYSTGAANGGSGTNVGGMVGLSDQGTISRSYSTGAPSAGSGSFVGGFVGDDESTALAHTYWDITTSGITNASQGAGNISNAAGIIGLSTSQLQSGLPPGFGRAWNEKEGTNDGLPYVVANPPRK